MFHTFTLRLDINAEDAKDTRIIQTRCYPWASAQLAELGPRLP